MESNGFAEIVKEKSLKIDEARREIAKVVVGQDYMVERLLIGLITGGHILLEGVPGLAKSLTVSTMSKILGTSYKRIQFTPDLLPADIVGTMIYNQKTGEFITRRGPIFSNIILADEINRAPAKVQAALLEAMQEKQVTIGDTSYKLQEPFLVLATQNPIEQEGTYSLPEAQQDRFMLKLNITHPSRDEEREIIDRTCGISKIEDIEVDTVLTQDDIASMRKIVREIHIDDKLKEYVLELVSKTRNRPHHISCGASPRASISLIMAAKGRAFLSGRAYVIPDDIKAVVHDVLKHRLLLTYEAEADEITTRDIIIEIMEDTRIP